MLNNSSNSRIPNFRICSNERNSNFCVLTLKNKGKHAYLYLTIYIVLSSNNLLITDIMLIISPDCFPDRLDNAYTSSQLYRLLFIQVRS